MLSDARQPCDEGVLLSGRSADGCAESVGKWVLAAAILGSTISFIDGTVVNVALPVLQTSLAASVGQTQWIVESYALMLSALILTGGALGDRFGRKRIFGLGVLIFGIASVLCGLSMDANQLIAARAVQGIGGALLVPGSLALISANFAKERRGRAIGTWSSFTAIAAGIGPVLGGWLVQNFSWRWIFFINVPLVAAVLFITARYVPESRDRESNGRVDWAGTTLAIVGLGGIVFGFIESNTRGFRSPIVIASFVVGAAALALFLFAESRQKEPMMPLGLFRSPAFAGANVLTLLLYAGLGGLLFFLPFNLIQIKGYTPTQAGSALVPFVVTMFLLGRWAGGLVDRYGSKIPLVIGPCIAAIGFALFAVPGADSNSYWSGVFPAVMVMSIGMSIAVAPLTTTVMTAVEERHAGVASGINNAVSRTAGLIAVAAFGTVMIFAFANRFETRLNEMPIDAQTRQELAARSGSLAEIKMPEALDEAQRAGVKRAVDEAFTFGFRAVAIFAAVLALLSAVAAWWMIPGLQRSKEEKPPAP